MFRSFHDAVGYLFSSYSQSKPFRGPGLDKDTRTPGFTRELLDRIGAPDRVQRNIKVTGSKGKGSTSRLLAALLEAQGLKVGLFTSPHLIDFTERIRVNGQAISEADWLRLQTELFTHIESIRERMLPQEYFGPVGLVACIAALYFLEQETDVNVFELGRGARFDDVNQIEGDIAVITPVQLEHQEQLGPGIEDIAWNKAGVIQQGMRAAICAWQSQPVADVLKEEARIAGVKVFFGNEDFKTTGIEVSLAGTEFHLTTKRSHYEGIHLSLFGRNQAYNAGLAVLAAEEFLGHALLKDTLDAAFAKVEWPGRMQLIEGTSRVLVDGAINQESASYLREFAKLVPGEKKVLVVGVPADKDGFGVISELAPLVSEIRITRALNPHLNFDLEKMLDYASGLAPASVDENLPDALLHAQKSAGPEGLVIVAGTQSLVAETLEYLQVPTRDLQRVTV